MCYKRPGPRCSGHAKQKLDATRKRMIEAQDKDDVEAYVTAADEYKLAQQDYDMTPKGQKSLKEAIERTGDKDYTLRNRQERGALKRAEALRKIGKRDEGDIDHQTLAPSIVISQPTGIAARVSPSSTSTIPQRSISIVGDNPYDVDYDSWPVPQADDLDKVSATVDAINAGANTSGSIGESIGNVHRGGSYYANAAGYIGLIAKSPDEYGVDRFYLTEHGERFVTMDSEERASMMSSMVNETPLMQEYRENPTKEQAEKMLSHEGLNEVSAKRRAGSLSAWYTAIQDKGSFARKIKTESNGVAQRAQGAILNQQREDLERYERKRAEQEASEPRRGSICSECFMEKSASGVCANCDD